jgi:ribosomal-protein-alanine N-acetyltransferase
MSLASAGARPLKTSRLDLIPMTRSLAASERAGGAALATALEVPEPAEWPPEFYDADDLERMEQLLDSPANAGWALYYLILRSPVRILVGVAGYSGRPTDAGVIELGYSVVPAHRRQGLATEAVAGLLEHAFQHPGVQLVVAETFPHLTPSIGVLLRNHFLLSAEPGRGGALRYELPRTTSLAGAPPSRA